MSVFFGRTALENSDILSPPHTSATTWLLVASMFLLRFARRIINYRTVTAPFDILGNNFMPVPEAMCDGRPAVSVSEQCVSHDKKNIRHTRHLKISKVIPSYYRPILLISIRCKQPKTPQLVLTGPTITSNPPWRAWARGFAHHRTLLPSSPMFALRADS